MTAVFYDTHAHLDYPDFATELDEVVNRAQSAGIVKIISIGTDLESSGHMRLNVDSEPWRWSR
jgi:TatD DNase family protein